MISVEYQDLFSIFQERENCDLFVVSEFCLQNVNG